MLKAIRNKYAQAGFRACLLTRFREGLTVSYTTPLLETISAADLAFTEGSAALVESAPGSAFSETQTGTVNGELFIQSVTLITAGLSADKRTLLHTLAAGRLHVLLQDNHGQWWLYGQKRGLRLRFRSESDSGMSVSLSGLEKMPACRVSDSLIPGFLTFLN